VRPRNGPAGTHRVVSCSKLASPCVALDRKATVLYISIKRRTGGPQDDSGRPINFNNSVALSPPRRMGEFTTKLVPKKNIVF
jgi:hypothetical protein